MSSDILRYRETHFVLWRPRNINPEPELVIGRLRPGNPPSFIDPKRFKLKPSQKGPDLWEIAAGECQLVNGEVYHYWYEVTDSNPYKGSHPRILCTDPLACTVDWRLLAPSIEDSNEFGEDDRDPPGVVKFSGGKLVPCDPGGETVDWNEDADISVLPPNNRLVIYELPTAWTRLEDLEARVELAVGTFRDIIALIEGESEPANFSGLPVLEKGRAHLKELGINALELLPPADSFVDREWGYATSNYFAADYDLGFPRRHLSPTATTDLVNLIKTCHRLGIRFFVDMVTAFATRYSYQNINYLDFHVQANAGDPEEFNYNGGIRTMFGGDPFKYNFWTTAYDPISGQTKNLVPARALMLSYLVRWMLDFRIDGIRMDSIENITNWDFVQEFRDLARDLWSARWNSSYDRGEGAEERFLVVGEELGVPIDLLSQRRIDGLWNENFKRMVRYAIMGKNDEKEPSFEWTVRKLIDCRLLGFQHCAQAINYLTSHDVEGFRNERLYNFLQNNGIADTEKRIKLAFVCLLTAVGIPMIFAGEEFADEHDLLTVHPLKQVDPVNYSRKEEPWRKRIFDYVSRLVKLRTSYDALAVNDINFIHVDFNEGKRVIVWQRETEESGKMVVVVANFSDYGTPDAFHPQSEYVVPSWPSIPSGKKWREVTQERDVPTEWAGREPLFPWEAKVYALTDSG